MNQKQAKGIRRFVKNVVEDDPTLRNKYKHNQNRAALVPVLDADGLPVLDPVTKRPKLQHEMVGGTIEHAHPQEIAYRNIKSKYKRNKRGRQCPIHSVSKSISRNWVKKLKSRMKLKLQTPVSLTS
jgi:hypothetical protein